MVKRFFIKAIILSAIFFTTIPSFAAGYHGTVFIDTNGNSQLDAGEKGLPGVLVSDGLNVVKTDSKGNYTLNGPVKNNFIFITIPNGYMAYPFYHRVSSDNGVYNFPLREKNNAKKKSVSFIQITDTETWDYGDWIDNLKGYIKNEHPDFMVHTGDICYDKGLDFHSKNINTETMGVPVFYCVGNHDLLKGNYGEEVYQKLFGPAYYSFDAGNVHFIVTPMLSGDYKPAYTKADVYHWLKNDLAMIPKGRPVVIFNHDLLTNVDDQKLISEGRFIYGISDTEKLDLNNHNLKAWVYGHWHTNFVKKHGNSGILSICSSPPDKGGIDHSESSFRVITVNEKGNVSIDTRYSYQNRRLEIAAPAKDMAPVMKNGNIKIIVNNYNTASPVSAVRYAVKNKDGKLSWKPMARQSSWSWYAEWKPAEKKQSEYQLVVESVLNNGDTITETQSSTYNPFGQTTLKTGAPWPMLLQNTAHHPDENNVASPKLQLAWVSNAGAPVYMSSPLIVDDKVFAATLDEGNLDEGKIIAFNAKDGGIKWKYKTENSMKGAIAYADGKVFAADLGGMLYALNATSGQLVWKKALDKDYLPPNMSGVIVTHDTLYAGSGKGLYALRANDGKEIWHNTSWDGGEGSTANQTLAGNVLLGSANWSALFANDAHTGKLLWSRDDEGLRFCDAAVSYTDGKLYATGGTKFFELNPVTGKNIRTKELPFGASGLKSASTPLVTDDAIIFGTGTNGVVALDKKTLEIKWQFATNESIFYTSPYTKPPAETVEASIIQLGHYIFFGASDGRLYLLDKNTGAKVWETSVGAPVFSAAAMSGNLLVVADFGGNVYAFNTGN